MPEHTRGQLKRLSLYLKEFSCMHPFRTRPWRRLALLPTHPPLLFKQRRAFAPFTPLSAGFPTAPGSTLSSRKMSTTPGSQAVTLTNRCLESKSPYVSILVLPLLYSISYLNRCDRTRTIPQHGSSGPQRPSSWPARLTSFSSSRSATVHAIGAMSWPASRSCTPR